MEKTLEPPFKIVPEFLDEWLEYSAEQLARRLVKVLARYFPAEFTGCMNCWRCVGHIVATVTMSIDVDKVTGTIQNVGNALDVHTSGEAGRRIQVIDQVVHDRLKIGVGETHSTSLKVLMFLGIKAVSINTSPDPITGFKDMDVMTPLFEK
ncbi:hypothetical protein QCA50_019903 [Cerrena zonata]|uniref:Uncharacterized protein n=1 Tax=Cerrena zonata TaxID=2478898 RepID=A0AAW0FEH0_9APHY